MSRKIKLQIRGRNAETDAPTVDDFLDQMRDYFEILRGVEEAVADDGTAQIEWRIVDAKKQSPLAIEAEAFPRQFAMNVDLRASIVMRATAEGLDALQKGAERPNFFSEKVLVRAERLFDRVTDGVADMQVDYGDGLPSLTLNFESAYAARAHVRTILTPAPKSYRELGSVEAWAQSLGRDGWGNPTLRVCHRLTGDEFACRLSGQALAEVESRHARDILSRSRVQLYGVIYFKSLGRISRIDASRVRFLRNKEARIGVDEIQDDNFTGNIGTEEYLERLRNGHLS